MSDDPRIPTNTGLERIKHLETEALLGTCENYETETIGNTDQVEPVSVDNPDRLACDALIRTTDPSTRAALLNAAAVRFADAENPWDVTFQDAVIVGEIALNTSDPVAYNAAIFVLANNGSETAIEYLGSALIGDPNTEHRIDALHALTNIGTVATDDTNHLDNPARGERINEYLVNALRNDTNSDVRQEALNGLASTGNISVVVETVLENTDNGTQIAAIKKITATAGEEVAIATLKAFLLGRGERRAVPVKIEAARELGRIGTEEANQALSNSYTANVGTEAGNAILVTLSSMQGK